MGHPLDRRPGRRRRRLRGPPALRPQEAQGRAVTSPTRPPPRLDPGRRFGVAGTIGGPGDLGWRRNDDVSLDTVREGPGGLPGVGHLVAFGRDPLGFLGTLADHGDLVEIGWGPRPVLVLCSPDLADHVLRDPETFDKGGPYFDRFRQIFGLGLFTSEREQHRRQRALIQPLFHRDRIAEYSQVMAATAAEVTGRWRSGQVVDVVREMTEITMQVTLKCMFTVSLAEDERAKVGAAAASLLNDAFWRFVMPNSWDRLPTPSTAASGDRCTTWTASCTGSSTSTATAAPTAPTSSPPWSAPAARTTTP
ncbi:cytochrome P450 [Actinokineospora soli]|uniref:Cytochrome P450 n=1 Tax=Actinokineospora soli TaxID=1048753 RepID=A0ABW2TVC5_9PSEU